ncbi:MAG: serine/threonine-protein kinase, partial [bacterium]
MIGKTISHYKILEELGRGGMGVVYKAEDTKLKRTVALKFLTESAIGSGEQKKRFLREAQAAASLNHPNIATIHEIDEAEGQIFIAMEFIEGSDLVGVIHESPLRIDHAVDYAVQIAEGLHAAHKKKIIHRDIKPANILLTDEEPAPGSRGQVKIVDFGLAKLAGMTRLTKEGTSMGTVAYMSPEQTQGAEADHRTDIWALGAVIYEMLTGRQPFAGDYEQAVMYSIMNEEQEPVTGLRTGIPMELERIVNKCLGKDPANRYQHADDLIVDLHQVKKGQEPQKALTGTPAKPKSQKSKAVRFVLFGSALAVLILMFVAYLFFPSKREASFERKMLVVLP